MASVSTLMILNSWEAFFYTVSSKKKLVTSYLKQMTSFLHNSAELQMGPISYAAGSSPRAECWGKAQKLLLLPCPFGLKKSQITGYEFFLDETV